jgi:hypothetical protein
MSSALFYLPYYPNITWLQNFVKQESVFIEASENFVKSTLRNRCEIAGANGKQLLTIPIIGGRDHHQLYKGVKISYTENWQKKHWQSICSAYGSAPFFEFYSHKFQAFYEKEFEFLFEFNLELLRTTLSALKLKSNFELTTTYGKEVTGKLDFRSDKEKSELKYYQVFEERNGCIQNLCALDLIFNEGNRSSEILLS